MRFKKDAIITRAINNRLNEFINMNAEEISFVGSFGNRSRLKNIMKERFRKSKRYKKFLLIKSERMKKKKRNTEEKITQMNTRYLI